MNNTNKQTLQGKAAWIARLKAGETVSFRESGNSMHPRIKHRQKCTYAPITGPEDVKVGDYVFCKVGPWTLTHMITAIKGDAQKGFMYQISKAGLNKSILDAGWYSFRMILKSKAENAGREFIEINPAYTSQDCSHCGYRPPKEERKKLSDRWHTCPKCGFSAHRDKNSAILQDKIGVGLHTVRHRPIEAVAFTRTE